MANKLYQKQGGQLVEVSLGGSSQDLSQYVTSSAAQSIASAIVSSGGYAVDTNVVHKTGNETISGAKTFASKVEAPNIEFTGGSTNGGYIDFHYDKSTSDYTTRIIEQASGELGIKGALAVAGHIHQKPDTSGTAAVFTDNGYTNSAAHKVSLQANGAGNAGVYDHTNSRWLLCCNSANNLYLGELAPGVTINGGGYFYAKADTFSKGQTPSGNVYCGEFWANDANGTGMANRVGGYQVFVSSDGGICNEISTKQNISGSTGDGMRLRLWYNDNTSRAVATLNRHPPTTDNEYCIPTIGWMASNGAAKTATSATSAGTITSTLPVSKGGTGATTLASAGIITSGGAQTITGIKLFNNEVHLKSSECICTTVENGFTALRGGTNGGGGGAFVACGVNRSSYPGSFRIFSNDGTTSYVLMGTQAGALSWNGKTVTTSSDERIKTPIRDIPDAVLDAWEDVHWGEFKYLASIENKQNNARLHTGLIAQQIDRVFKLHGLDACSYGILCHEEEPEHNWEEEQEDGTKITKHEAAVDLWMVRYTEASAIEAAYQRRRADRLEERVKKLEEAFASFINTNQ